MSLAKCVLGRIGSGKKNSHRFIPSIIALFWRYIATSTSLQPAGTLFPIFSRRCSHALSDQSSRCGFTLKSPPQITGLAHNTELFSDTKNLPNCCSQSVLCVNDCSVKPPCGL